MTDPTAPPAFMRNCHRSEEKLWRDLEAEFQDAASFIRGLRFSSSDKARRRREPSEFAFEPEGQHEENKASAIPLVKHAGLLPFRETDDSEFLRDALKYARLSIDELEPLIVKREATPDLLLRWGRFQYAVGLLMNTYLSKPSKAAVAAGIKVSILKQRQLVAHLLWPMLKDRVPRKAAERKVTKTIQEFIGRGIFPPDYPQSWFERILSKDKKGLMGSFKNISQAEIEALASAPTDDIPSPEILGPLL